VSLRLAGRDVESLLIVGYGMTGRAVAGFCERRGVRFAVSEASALSEVDEAWLRDHAWEVETGGHTSRLLDYADVVVASPGAPAHLPLFAAAAERGIPVWSELDIAWAAVAGRRLVAVTGTNGKSTTVSLIGALLGRSEIRATVAGNIGLPFLDIVDEVDCWDVAVLEVSSFQLEQSVLFHPHVAVLLNLAPNHLERHGTMPAYVAAKLRLFSHQTPLDVAILPAILAGTVDHGLGRLVLYDQPCPPLPRGSEAVGEVRRLDLAAAVTACREIVPASTRRVGTFTSSRKRCTYRSASSRSGRSAGCASSMTPRQRAPRRRWPPSAPCRDPWSSSWVVVRSAAATTSLLPTCRRSHRAESSCSERLGKRSPNTSPARGWSTRA